MNLKSFLYGFLVSFVLFAVCVTLIADHQNKHIKIKIPLVGTVYEPPNYDSMCIIGKQYIIYPFDYKTNKNPFEKNNPAHVTVVAVSNGYVAYCYTNEYKTPNQYNFNKTCKDFIEATKMP